MPFYLAWLCKKGQCTKIFFWLLTHLSNNFAPYIKNLETYFAILICFEFWPLWSVSTKDCTYPRGNCNIFIKDFYLGLGDTFELFQNLKSFRSSTNDYLLFHTGLLWSCNSTNKMALKVNIERALNSRSW